MSISALIIRADASVSIGTGHIMRCLALAQAWKDLGGECVFAMAETTPGVINRLKAENIEIVLLPPVSGEYEEVVQLAEVAARRGFPCVVLDGYQFSGDYQREVKGFGLKLVCIDDKADVSRYWADLLINQNENAAEEMYPNRESYTQILLGTDYVMLRREFRRWSDRHRQIALTRLSILVTMGGTDPDNMTSRVLASLGDLDRESFDVTIVCGGSSPHFHALVQQVETYAKKPVLLSDVENIDELMQKSDLAIIAAGGTLWELLFSGCPVISYARSEVQAEIIGGLAEKGLILNMGLPDRFESTKLNSQVLMLASSPERRLSMSAQGRELIDGKGVERICGIIRGL